jgi:hypothetical protein
MTAFPRGARVTFRTNGLATEWLDGVIDAPPVRDLNHRPVMVPVRDTQGRLWLPAAQDVLETGRGDVAA